jgi:hypothetical protein
VSGTCPSLQFSLQGHTVETNASTTFSKIQCRDVKKGVDLSVHGELQSDGSVLALEVKK